MANKTMHHAVIGADTFELIDEAGREETSQLKNALTTKAEQDGAYPDLTAGQMLSKNEASDSVPYNFRAVGQNSTLEYTDAIVGGTIVNNQFCNDPTFTDESKWYSSSNMTVTISNNVAECIASAVNAILSNNGIRSAGTLNAHVVGVLCDLKADEAYNVNIAFGDNYLFTDLQNKAINTSWTTYGMLAKHAEVKMKSVYVGIRDSHNSDWKKIYVKNYRVFDLTQMFGTAIADFLYSLGSEVGIAWLKKHFPKLFTYQEYNAGEIVSVQGLSQHVTTGFNQWDEEWEVGGISGDDGQNLPNTDRIRSKNYIPIIPNETYYFCYTGTVSDLQLYVCTYDGNKNFIARTTSTWNVTKAFADNVRYVRFFIYHTNGITVYNHDICINLSDPTRNGEYEPYQKRTYPLDSTKTFRGIFKLDSSNRLYADGDRYLPDGTVQRRYGVVEINGTSDIVSGGYGMPFRFVLSDMKAAPTSVLANIVCNKMTVVTQASTWGVPFTFASGASNIYFKLSEGLTDINDAKTYLATNPMTFVYELATPTTETADPYTNPQIVAPGGTEEYISTSVVPVGHESRYPDDLRTKLDDLPRNLSMIAPIENGDKASQAYAVGKYFLHNNQFCKAKTSIASGATLTLNTNYEVTTVADELYSALH